jgi:hypothetical protein
VGKVKGPGGEWLIGDGSPGPVTMRLRDELLGLQYGQRPDPFGWIHKVCLVTAAGTVGARTASGRGDCLGS